MLGLLFIGGFLSVWLVSGGRYLGVFLLGELVWLVLFGNIVWSLVRGLVLVTCGIS